VLHLHRADRADGLVEALSGLLARPPADPFAREVVAVPTRGMERWLTQRLSARLGASRGAATACAPTSTSRRRAGWSDRRSPRRPAWTPTPTRGSPSAPCGRCSRRSTPALDEPWLALLAGHLGEEGDAAARARRFSTVRHLAGLFDRYALQRPAMLRAWAEGADVDALGGPLPEDTAWQAELWRRLRARIGTPGPAERLEAACARLTEEPSVVDLPERVALFGLTRLPAGHLAVLRALAATATCTCCCCTRRRHCGRAWPR
jgi:exodeoxyribonuclease V gamma subunit